VDDSVALLDASDSGRGGGLTQRENRRHNQTRGKNTCEPKHSEERGHQISLVIRTEQGREGDTSMSDLRHNRKRTDRCVGRCSDDTLDAPE
jgi:hypothetical protein